MRSDVDLYGYRGSDARVFLLSPWEFWTHWYAEELLPPTSESYCLTVWVPSEMDGKKFKCLKEAGLECRVVFDFVRYE